MTPAARASASRAHRAAVALAVWSAGAGLFWWAAGPRRLLWTPAVVAAAASLVTVTAFSGPLGHRTAPRCAPCAYGSPVMIVTALLVYAGDPLRPSTVVTSLGLLALGLGLARRKATSCPVPTPPPADADSASLGPRSDLTDVYP